MRLYGYLGLSCVLLLSACASGGESSTNNSNVIAPVGGVGVVAPNTTVPTAARATRGSSTTADVLAAAGGANQTAPVPGTVFPLIQSAMQSNDNIALPLAVDAGTNSSGATLTVLDANTVRLVIPALRVDAQFDPGSAYFFSRDGQMIILSAQSMRYVRWGAWNAENVVTGFSEARFIAGYQTPANAMPGSGTATYSGSTTGTIRALTETRSYNGGVLTGTASLNANFSTGAVTGALTNMVANPDAGKYTWNDVSLQANISGNGISGTASVTTAPGTPLSLKAEASGTVQGGFYGPTADEIAAVWTLADGTTMAWGSLGAARK